MPRHVRRVARRAVGESVGLIVDSFFEELVGWPLCLEGVFSLDLFCQLSESRELVLIRPVWLVL